MTAADQELDAVDGVKLKRIVSRLLAKKQVDVVDWRWAPIDYDVYLPGRRVVRFVGQAVADGERHSWELILKVMSPHERLTREQDQKWRREAQAYASGVLSDLPGGLAAPQALAIDTMADGSVWLWLEQVTDIYSRRWGLDQFRQAAYHLGEFNGAYLDQRPLPEYPWLVRGWTELQSETAKIPAARAEFAQLTDEPPVRAAFPDWSAVEMIRLLDDQQLFKVALNRLPALLCHHDASQSNLFARRLANGQAQTVAIDWESIGPGAFGGDIASLVFGTVRRGLFEADNINGLDDAVFAGYLAGLRDAGWRGAAEPARLGFAAAIALRWFQLHGVLRMLTNPTTPVLRGTAQESADEGRRQYILLAKYLLGRAEEARTLIS